MAPAQDVRLGRILRVLDKAGLGYLIEEGLEGKQFPFTFNTIAGYRGEEPRELYAFSPKGLKPGIIVKFEVEAQNPEASPKIKKIIPLFFQGA